MQEAERIYNQHIHNVDETRSFGLINKFLLILSYILKSKSKLYRLSVN